MKTEEKFDRLMNDIQDIKEHQAHIRADLNYHIKRTDLLEGFMKSQIKVLLTIITAVLASVTVAYFNKAEAADIDTALAKIQKEVPCKLSLHSGKRSPEHNKRVGGAPKSLHLTDRARDISAPCLSHKELGKIAKKHVNGVIVYKSHVHIDNREIPLYKEM